jgi:hypothetical protein
MRLTLRTLLAYLNQSNLNLRAVERIEAKLKGSPTASKLIEDLREIMADPQVAALAPDCDEGFKEANWVAEYLDNSLDESNVEAFERQAFESTLLLSEIAGCHEVLSAVGRNELAVVPAALRQRAYEIGRSPLETAGGSQELEIEYLGSATVGDGSRKASASPLVADFQQAETEFRLGPPPEESQRHDEWADAISSEEFIQLHRSGSAVLRWSLLAAGIALIVLVWWLVFRG